jgi:hypothetical protein
MLSFLTTTGAFPLPAYDTCAGGTERWVDRPGGLCAHHSGADLTFRRSGGLQAQVLHVGGEIAIAEQQRPTAADLGSGGCAYP